jgi:hypothetical protein
MSHAESNRITPGDWAFYGTLLFLFVIGSIWAVASGTVKLTPFELTPMGASEGWRGLGVLIAAGLTLAFYSFLYKDNPFFKAAEHLYVGVGLGYTIVLAWFQYLKGELYVPLIKYWVRPDTAGRPDYVLIVPMVLSAFLLARLVKPFAWMSRWAFAFIVGYGAGLAIPTVVQANILQQLDFTLIPVIVRDANGAIDWVTAINTVVIIAGVVSVLIYFYFSTEHTGVVGVTSKVGVWFLMVCFGASFGYTVMGRMALGVGRITFLINKWLGLDKVFGGG